MNQTLIPKFSASNSRRSTRSQETFSATRPIRVPPHERPNRDGGSGPSGETSLTRSPWRPSHAPRRVQHVVMGQLVEHHVVPAQPLVDLAAEAGLDQHVARPVAREVEPFERLQL